jgi:hypothetical protein
MAAKGRGHAIPEGDATPYLKLLKPGDSAIGWFTPDNAARSRRVCNAMSDSAKPI